MPIAQLTRTCAVAIRKFNQTYRTERDKDCWGCILNSNLYPSRAQTLKNGADGINESN